MKWIQNFFIVGHDMGFMITLKILYFIFLKRKKQEKLAYFGLKMWISYRRGQTKQVNGRFVLSNCTLLKREVIITEISASTDDVGSLKYNRIFMIIIFINCDGRTIGIKLSQASELWGSNDTRNNRINNGNSKIYKNFNNNILTKNSFSFTNTSTN